MINYFEKFTEIIPTAAGCDPEDVEEYLKKSERWLIQNILGKNLYIDITSNENENELVSLIKQIVCNDAYDNVIPFIDLRQGASGFEVTDGKTHNVASKNRVSNLRAQCIINRDNAIDDIIDILETRKDLHDSWKGSKAYASIADCIIHTRRELSSYGWEGNYSDFIKIKSKLKLNTKLVLNKMLGSKYIDRVSESIADEDLHSADLKILDTLKMILVQYTFNNYDAYENLRIQLLSDIDANIDDYPEYKASREYENNHIQHFKNSQDSKLFVS